MEGRNIKDADNRFAGETENKELHPKISAGDMCVQSKEVEAVFCDQNKNEEARKKGELKLTFVDTHAHITDKAFEGEEKLIVRRARECGVEFVITSGYDAESSRNAVECAENYENVFASIGFYPENCEEYNEDVLKELAKSKKVVAIGEIGLQYTENMPPKEKQIEVFEKQIKLAHLLKLPIVIHCREAYGDCLDVLKKNKQYLNCGGTLHCYSGSSEMAKELVKMGLHISIGGVSTFKNAEKIKEAVASTPLERILLETDCPYLAPHPYRGKRNEPSLIPIIAENLANLKEISEKEVAEQTTENARRLFNI